MKACTAREGSIRYVVVRFDDRNRYGQTGVPATLLFSGGERCVVRMKEETIQKAGKRNRFGKIQMVGARGEAQLEELQRRKSAAEEAEAKAEAERGALEKAKEEALTARGVAEVAVRAVEASEADGVAQLVKSEPPSGANQPARMCAPTA